MHRAAARVELADELVAKLDYPGETLAASIPLRMDDGGFRQLKAWRCRYDSTLGPTKGGIRFHENVCADEVQTLAFLMTMKTSLMGLPFGGGKGGVHVNAKDLSLMEKERLARGYVRAFAKLIGPDRDIPAPDVATGEMEMAWMADEYSRLRGAIHPASFTGKPCALGGIEGRTPATGRGALIAFEAVRERLAVPEDGVRFALQGFGNAGRWFARAAVEAGHSLVAVSDSTGMVRCNNGLDLEALVNAKEEGGSVTDTAQKGIETGDGAGILQADCDVLALAALGGAVDADNAGELACSAVLEIANAPVLPEADETLREAGIEVVPDILANGGGVSISHAEWVHNRTGDRWDKTRVENRLKDVMQAASARVLTMMDAHELDMRTAAYASALVRLCAAISAQGTEADFRVS